MYGPTAEKTYLGFLCTRRAPAFLQHLDPPIRFATLQAPRIPAWALAKKAPPFRISRKFFSNCVVEIFLGAAVLLTGQDVDASRSV